MNDPFSTGYSTGYSDTFDLLERFVNAKHLEFEMCLSEELDELELPACDCETSGYSYSEGFDLGKQDAKLEMGRILSR